jgi:N utilization substance protein B
VTPTPRHQAREAALQILYFWQMGGVQPSAAIGSFFSEHQPEATDATRVFAESLVYGTIGHIADLDRLIEQHSKNWRLERIAVIDRLVLRMAAFELQHQPETPAPIVMNEAIELARTFSGDESVPFVNGVLDAMRKAMGTEPGGANGDVERS